MRKKLSGEPQLSYFYGNATQAVFGIRSRVKVSVYPRFISKEKELLIVEITPRDYAYGVVVLLEKWVANKGMKTLPINAFLGKWAWDKYMKVHDSISVTIDDVDSDITVGLLWSELLVARTYIQSNLIKSKRLCVVVDELEPLLSELWLELYDANDRTRIETLALLQLEDEYLVKYPKSYAHIVTELVLNGHS